MSMSLKEYRQLMKLEPRPRARYIAEPMLLKMKLWEPGDYTEPALVVTRQDSQSLMNALWEAGVRPRDGSGALAHVDAMKYHLEDMRKLVFERK